MADETLQSFTTTTILGGLLLTSLLFFAIGFMINNNSSALGDDVDGVFSDVSSAEKTSLLAASSDSNELLNITSNTNPETSDLGSRDIVATGFGAAGQATSKWEQAKTLIAYVFSGETGKVLLGVLGGLMGLTIYFLVTKHIRLGT